MVNCIGALVRRRDGDTSAIWMVDIAVVSPSLHQTSAPIQFSIVLGVLGTQETLCYLVAGLLERDHLHPTHPTD